MITIPEMYQTIWYMKNNIPQNGIIHSIKISANSSNKINHHVVVQLDDGTSHNIFNISTSKEILKNKVFGERTND